MKKKRPLVRAQLVLARGGDYYILQIQRRLLFFTWWETMKRGDNGIWNYGDAHFTKEEVDEFFEKWNKYWEQGGKFETYRER